MKIKITFFAHGATVDNELGLATGWRGGELSAMGRRQAKELGGLAADKKFDAVFCSDLKRAVESANLAFGGKYKIIADKRLRECDYGDLTGKPFKEIENHLVDYIDQSFPNGESLKDVEKRIADFCAYLKTNYDGKIVAIISHQAPQLALEVLLNGKTWEQAIAADWRKTKSWRSGWEYVIK
jgi:broad specificity phosphatase PhoE